MTESAEQLKAQLANLSVEDREELLEFLEASLRDGAAADIQAAWDAELERRWEGIESGKTVGIPVEQMAAELRRKYG